MQKCLCINTQLFLQAMPLMRLAQTPHSERESPSKSGRLETPGGAENNALLAQNSSRAQNGVQMSNLTNLFRGTFT